MSTMYPPIEFLDILDRLESESWERSLTAASLLDQLLAKRPELITEWTDWMNSHYTSAPGMTTGRTDDVPWGDSPPVSAEQTAETVLRLGAAEALMLEKITPQQLRHLVLQPERLAQPVTTLAASTPSAVTPAHPSPGSTAIYYIVTAAAAAILGALLSWALLNPKSPEGPKPPLVLAAKPIVDWGFEAEALSGRSGTAQRVVFSGQRFHFQPRIASNRSYGWLYQIDSRNTYMLQKLTKQRDGTLTGSYQDRFDDNTGYEYFLIILGDEDLPVLNAGDRPATWLAPQDRKRLQDLATLEGKETRAVQVILDALRRHGWTGTPDDIRIQRLKHNP